MTVYEWIEQQKQKAWELCGKAPLEVCELAGENYIFWKNKLNSLTIEQAEIEIAADAAKE